ncbi:unnamed protein product [Alternaria sp. RS040]
MADPLSITASIITLLHVSVQVTVLIKQFRDEVVVVDATLTGLLDDVNGFQRVLESMKETIEENNNKETLQATGHVGSHWKNLARSLEDGADALQKLHTTLDMVNKKSSILDAPRKQLRLKSASDQIARYREQIQTSHTAIQLSLSTIILWNQVTFQRSTEMIPVKVVPTLDKLYDEFRTFGSLLNAKIEKLQHTVTDQNDPDNYELMYMNNLRECVRSAADVVSTASTTLNAETSDKTSVKHGSDFGDVFVKDANEPMLRWFASNTVYEFEDVEAPLPAPSEASTGDAQTEYQSDSDSDIENDLIRSLFNEGRKRKDIGDLESAVRHFRNCLTRLSSNTRYTSLTSAKSAAAYGVSIPDLLECLLDCYCLLEAWGKAKAIMKDKLFITERQLGKKDELYLRDTLRLAELMMKNGEYVEAHLQARRSLRGFRKLGKLGNSGYEECLDLLIRICSTEGKVDEEEAYTALLASHERKTKRSAPSPEVISLSRVSPKFQSASDPVLEDVAQANFEVSEQVKETLDHVHVLESNEVPLIDTEDSSVLSPGELQVQLPEKSQFHSTDQTVLQEDSEPVTERDKITSEQQPSYISRPYSSMDDLSVRPDYETKSLSSHSVTSSEQHALTLASQEEVCMSHKPSDTCGLSVIPQLPAMLSPADFGDISHLEGHGAQIAAAEFICMLYRAAANEVTEKESRDSRKDAEFLKAWCNLFHGRDPYYFSEWHVEGYYCMIKINDTHGCTVSGHETEQKAKEAAVAKVSTNDFARLPYDRHQTPLNFLNLNAPKGAIIRRKVILLGDTLCGKTFLASAWSQGDVPEEDTPVMNHFIRSTKIRDRQIELVIWDNTGREGYEMMRRLSYEDAHIVLICFDISDPDSFENIDYMWSAEANEHLRDLPKILVGCKKELRNDNAKLDSLRRQHFIPVSPYAADRLAIKIQALAYFETSAIKKQGLSELFDYVAEAALRTVPKSKSSGIRKALSRGV